LDPTDPTANVIKCDGVVEHIDCHSDAGHEPLVDPRWLAALARHSAECQEVMMGDSPWDDYENARGYAAQVLEDGRYQCICSEGSC
jgi:hypothetical protein